MECKKEHKSLVPLRSVVAAAIVDSYEDIGKAEELYSFWAARGLRKLLLESLRIGSRKILLHVNKNTMTATLPPDFRQETFVGFINPYGYKEPLLPNHEIVDTLSVEQDECESSKCPKCHQEKNICEEMQITDSVNVIDINGLPYNETVIKKLFPNGDYKLITTTPVLNTESNTIEYISKEEYIDKLDLKECGCLETTAKNLEKVKCCCGDVYYTYYSSSCPCTQQYGSYKIFPETNRIQLDHAFPFDKVYLEYIGFMPKIGGDYYVPEVAFETLVEWTKWKSIQNRKGVQRWERNDQFDHYVRERRNMEKNLGRINLSIIIAAIGLSPKFD